MTSFLTAIGPDQRVTITVRDVGVTVDDITSPAAKVVKRVFGSEQHRKHDPYPQLLQSVTCEFLPGEVSLVLAPESGGEPALLHTLANPNDPLYYVSGKVLFNGAYAATSLAAALKDDSLAGGPCIGALVQHSVIAQQGPAASVAAADELLTVVGLNDHKFAALVQHGDREEASPDRHLRKRVKVAQALASHPAVLLVHEPLLDSTPAQAGSMMQLLRQLADSGRTVVIGTEEGMDEEAYHKVDKVLLLSRGRMMYYGRASEAVTWFATHGHNKPDGMSVPDFLINLADGAFTDDPEKGEYKRAELVEFAAAFLQAYPQGYKGGEIPAMTDDDDDDDDDMASNHAGSKLPNGAIATAVVAES